MLRTVSRFGVLFGVVLTLAALWLLAGTGRAFAQRVTVLDDRECASLLGGQGCVNGQPNCQCSSVPCGGTSKCAVTTCTNVGGHCLKLVVTQNNFCGGSSSDFPKGCTGTTPGPLATCGTVYDCGTPYYGCDYPCANMINPPVASTCGDQATGCTQF